MLHDISTQREEQIMNILNKSIFACILCVLFSVSAFAARELPHGVPDPIKTWLPDNYQGDFIHPIDGVAPASWDSAQQAGLPAYYIDNSSPQATDSSNTFGTPEKPRISIPEIAYSAGSYIEIHGGPYTGGGQIIFTANGTPDQPVWFRGPAVENKGIIAGEVIVKGQYIFMENLRFEGSRPLSLRTHNNSMLSNMVVRDMTFTGDGSKSWGSAIAIYSTSSERRFHDLLFYDNEISFLGNDYDDVDPSQALSTENDVHGIHPDVNVDRVWIFNNDIHNLGGDSVQVSRVSAGVDNKPTQIYIADNEFYSNLENAVDVKQADYTLVINNRIYDWRQHRDNSSTGTAIVVHGKATNTWVVNNHISDAANGIVVSDVSLNTWVIGNSIQNIRHSSWDTEWNPQSIYTPGSAIHFRGGSSGGAVNNTIINADKGINTDGSGYAFVNNIISNRNEPFTYDISAATSQSSNNISFNLIHHSQSEFEPSFMYATCTSCVYQAPGFQPLSNELNFTIGASSPAMDAGVNIDYLLTDYTTAFGAELSVDIVGEERLSGSIDIGAHEYPGGSEPIVTLPNMPTITDISVNQAVN